MSNKPRTLAEIFHEAKSVRLRVRNTTTLKDYLCLYKLNRMWVMALDVHTGLQTQLMTITAIYGRLSCDEEVSTLVSLDTGFVKKIIETNYEFKY